MDEFVYRTRIQAPAAAVFAWHHRPEALRKLLPPWEPAVIIKPPAGIHDGATAVLRVRVGPLRFRWVARHVGYQDRGPRGGEFTDVQVYGPFAHWEHTHRVEADGPDACILEDRIRYELPLGRVGRLLAHAMTRRRLARTFAFRHNVIKSEAERSPAAA